MPREINVQIKIPMPMRELTKAVVRTLAENSEDATNFSRVVGDRLVELDERGESVGNYTDERGES